jgi:hypothetical protein
LLSNDIGIASESVYPTPVHEYKYVIFAGLILVRAKIAAHERFLAEKFTKVGETRSPSMC